MKKSLTIVTVALIAISGYSQNLETTQRQSFEYYYCYAMSYDSILHSNILEFASDSLSKILYIEEKWQSHVNNTLRKEYFVPVIAGPYIDRHSAELDQAEWASNFPDSITVVKIEYTLE